MLRSAFFSLVGEMTVKADQILAAVQTQTPLVHCITNYVAMNIAANVVLAVGASPAMVHAEAEVADFVPISGALTINIGTLSPSWVAAMQKAADAATASDTPWVLDPVAHFATPYRSKVVQDLIARGPTIVRGNASEILALSGAATAGKGADSGDSVSDAESVATALALTHECVVAITGQVDFVTDGTRAARISGGSDIMPMITAMGCSLTALMGAFVAVAPPLEATVTALAMFAEAGTRAAQTANGPGSFQVAFLDALSQIKPVDLASDANVQWL
ncbi:MAG: hydroxyethylthiazole kinase [Alteromonas macleodii]|jgi:hydroxyethylthiazole kinase